MSERLNHNPDVLSCLANLSSDEVFTPPEIANAMLDMLPKEIFKNPEIRFLDPFCKTGIFLREIAKRLLDGLEDSIPDLQERIEHIFHKQLYGIAITELTSLLARRSLYCSKYANSIYSVSAFEDVEGNIRFKRIEHTWDSEGKCQYCGASREQFDRGDELETHAYEFIHIKTIEELYKMKFDIIIGNPPYHLETGGAGKQAKPIYDQFVNQAMKLKPRFLAMITPSRWFAGGMNLDTFRKNMMNDGHIRYLVDYLNAKDCFPQNSIGGGVSYFLWDRDNPGPCEFTNISNGKRMTMTRNLNDYPVLVRYNEGISILAKIRNPNFKPLSDIVSPLMPFGLGTDYRGHDKRIKGDYILHTSKGISYVSPVEVQKGVEFIDCFKILISKTSSEHAGEPSKQGDFRVLTSSMKVIGPGEICTHSYFVIGQFTTKEEAENLYSYLCTRFVRFLLLLSLSSINLSKLVFTFVPMQEFSKPWSDEELYIKYGLKQDEIDFIESLIRPMDAGGSDE